MQSVSSLASMSSTRRGTLHAPPTRPPVSIGSPRTSVLHGRTSFAQQFPAVEKSSESIGARERSSSGIDHSLGSVSSVRAPVQPEPRFNVVSAESGPRTRKHTETVMTARITRLWCVNNGQITLEGTSDSKLFLAAVPSDWILLETLHRDVEKEVEAAQLGPVNDLPLEVHFITKAICDSAEIFEDGSEDVGEQEQSYESICFSVFGVSFVENEAGFFDDSVRLSSSVVCQTNLLDDHWPPTLFEMRSRLLCQLVRLLRGPARKYVVANVLRGVPVALDLKSAGDHKAWVASRREARMRSRQENFVRNSPSTGSTTLDLSSLSGSGVDLKAAVEKLASDDSSRRPYVNLREMDARSMSVSPLCRTLKPELRQESEGLQPQPRRHEFQHARSNSTTPLHCNDSAILPLDAYRKLSSSSRQNSIAGGRTEPTSTPRKASISSSNASGTPRWALLAQDLEEPQTPRRRNSARDEDRDCVSGTPRRPLLNAIEEPRTPRLSSLALPDLGGAGRAGLNSDEPQTPRKSASSQIPAGSTRGSRSGSFIARASEFVPQSEPASTPRKQVPDIPSTPRKAASFGSTEQPLGGGVARTVGGNSMSTASTPKASAGKTTSMPASGGASTMEGPSRPQVALKTYAARSPSVQKPSTLSSPLAQRAMTREEVKVSSPLARGVDYDSPAGFPPDVTGPAPSTASSGSRPTISLMSTAVSKSPSSAEALPMPESHKNIRAKASLLALPFVLGQSTRSLSGSSSSGSDLSDQSFINLDGREPSSAGRYDLSEPSTATLLDRVRGVSPQSRLTEGSEPSTATLLSRVGEMSPQSSSSGEEPQLGRGLSLSSLTKPSIGACAPGPTAGFMNIKRSILKTNSMSRLDFSELSADSSSLEQNSARKEVDDAVMAVSTVRPYLLVGSAVVARDRNLLLGKDVTHVLNLTRITEPNHFPSDFKYLSFKILDNAQQDLLCLLGDICDFIDEARAADGVCFVHCHQGISRSCSAVLAYLVLRCGMVFDDAYRDILRVRPVASPNQGFLAQLAKLSRKYEMIDHLCILRIGMYSDRDPLYLVGVRDVAPDSARARPVSAQSSCVYLDERFVYLILPPNGLVSADACAVAWYGNMSPKQFDSAAHHVMQQFADQNARALTYLKKPGGSSTLDVDASNAGLAGPAADEYEHEYEFYLKKRFDVEYSDLEAAKSFDDQFVIRVEQGAEPKWLHRILQAPQGDEAGLLGSAKDVRFGVRLAELDDDFDLFMRASGDGDADDDVVDVTDSPFTPLAH